MRLIDADALVVKLKDWQGDKEDVDMSDPHEVGYYAAMGRAIRFTALAHTIDAYPITRADWVDPYAEDMIAKDMVYQCSNCHAAVFKTFSPTMNFCPNCGARMNTVSNVPETNVGMFGGAINAVD